MGLWYLERGSDKCIYLCCNGSRLQAPSGKGEVGFILDAKVQTHNSKSYIVFKATGEQPRALKLERFQPSANDLCGTFTSASSEEEFYTIFTLSVKPHINQSTGYYTPKSSNPPANTPSSSCSRKRPAGKTRTPQASKKPRPSEEDISNTLQKSFIGQFTLPISCLKEPTAARLVRPVDRVFVECLKHEMLANPTTDVAPMIGLVRLRPGVEFDNLRPEAYTYETLGGNNSRTALAELLEENAEVKTDPRYSRRLVSVYCNLTDEEAQHLAVKHNRQQSFVHQMTTQDKVQLCRTKLFACAARDMEVDEIPDCTTEWRDGCAATLMTTKLKLIDNMIFLLAGLPKESYKILLEIFHNFECRVANKKKQSSQSKPTCRGSNFRELRNLDNDIVQALLVRVRDDDIPLSHLNQECKQVKRLQKLKQAFANEVGEESWEEAMHKYPRYATEAALERFLAAPKLTGSILTAFQQYCSRAIRTATAAPPEGCQSSQSLELSVNGSTYFGIHLALSPEDITCQFAEALSPEDITYQGIATFIPQFSGFPLVIMRLAGHSKQEVMQLLRLVRAVNRGASQTGYVIFAFTCAGELSNLLELYGEEGLHSEVAYWNDTNSKQSGRGILADVVTPVAVGIAGVEVVKAQLTQTSSNLFTGGLCAYFEFLTKQFTSMGEWILEFDPLNGTENISAMLKLERNALLIGQDEILLRIQEEETLEEEGENSTSED